MGKANVKAALATVLVLCVVGAYSADGIENPLWRDAKLCMDRLYGISVNEGFDSTIPRLIDAQQNPDADEDVKEYMEKYFPGWTWPAWYGEHKKRALGWPPHSMTGPVNLGGAMGSCGEAAVMNTAYFCKSGNVASDRASQFCGIRGFFAEYSKGQKALGCESNGVEEFADEVRGRASQSQKNNGPGVLFARCQLGCPKVKNAEFGHTMTMIVDVSHENEEDWKLALLPAAWNGGYSTNEWFVSRPTDEGRVFSFNSFMRDMEVLTSGRDGRGAQEACERFYAVFDRYFWPDRRERDIRSICENALSLDEVGKTVGPEGSPIGQVYCHSFDVYQSDVDSCHAKIDAARKAISYGDEKDAVGDSQIIMAQFLVEQVKSGRERFEFREWVQYLAQHSGQFQHLGIPTLVQDLESRTRQGPRGTLYTPEVREVLKATTLEPLINSGVLDRDEDVRGRFHIRSDRADVLVSDIFKAFQEWSRWEHGYGAEP